MKRRRTKSFWAILKRGGRKSLNRKLHAFSLLCKVSDKYVFYCKVCLIINTVVIGNFTNDSPMAIFYSKIVQGSAFIYKSYNTVSFFHMRV